MELAFADRELRSVCLNPAKATQELGGDVAERLKRRLADMAAAYSVAELFDLPGSPKNLLNQPANLVTALGNGWGLFFTSGHTKERILENGDVDWTRVRRVKILKLEKQ